MMHTALYTIVRYAPFSETGEFANIGVVLASPGLNYFDFKILTKKYSRVSRFFDKMPTDVYRSAVKNLHAELKRMSNLTNKNLSQYSLRFEDKTMANLLLSELMRKKEGVIRFSDLRLAMAENPDQELDRLYKYYVDKSFATHEYTEQVLVREVRATLKQYDVSSLYNEQRFEDGIYTAKFPFVRKEHDKAISIIKPLSFLQERPVAVIEHANKWAYALRRLHEAGKLPNKVMIPVKAPEKSAGDRYAAYKEAVSLLEKENAFVADADNKSALKQYLAET